MAAVAAAVRVQRAPAPLSPTNSEEVLDTRNAAVGEWSAPAQTSDQAELSDTSTSPARA